MDFLTFLKEYGIYVGEGVLFILSIIAIVIKNRPKTVDDFKLALFQALSMVPNLVTIVEEPGNGVKKHQEVVSWCMDYVRSSLHRALVDNEQAEIQTAVSEKIDIVLSSPKKKEVPNV